MILVLSLFLCYCGSEDSELAELKKQVEDIKSGKLITRLLKVDHMKGLNGSSQRMESLCA